MINFKNNPRKSIGLIFLIIFGMMFLMFGTQYLEDIYFKIFEQFGIRSRGLSKLLSGDFAGDSGRKLIHRDLIHKINSSPVIGYGAAGSNVILDNGLTHSLILDIFGNLGYVMGGIFIVCVTIKIIKLFYKSKSDIYKREYIMICLSMFLPICTIQSSLWQANYMWYLIVMPVFIRAINNNPKGG